MRSSPLRDRGWLYVKLMPTKSSKEKRPRTWLSGFWLPRWWGRSLPGRPGTLASFRKFEEREAGEKRLLGLTSYPWVEKQIIRSVEKSNLRLFMKILRKKLILWPQQLLNTKQPQVCWGNSRRLTRVINSSCSLL